ncbi:MAG TPA: UDP-N-acetylmuramoyl-L-alanyl-D-glutamate--2,6-diaminopimelate ligase [Candidatus Hydrogenedentes bacterium]|jgi:UDP-N-acetylmuramoyl-L-alanyl-D-glutamate--2,6-diaminopimelate ligase|nr:UDP-N-acetylmuramoyl-L-alanyl-D-glutamate--2,6-diaminopimelate ligase [Candidatus Hydrogenedentota bacterium]HPK00183.1 UDP-N-acetylmuramoyl-L-alanyl-D-glutamate--2,6-diaminopimelate ligase [Candidatus Hydrogenedentota bacterium]
MRLKELSKWLNAERALETDAVITSAVEDSRRVTPGAVFVAIQGETSDGHEHATDAAGRGAVAIIGGRKGLEKLAGLPYVYVPNPRQTLGLLAHRLAGDPSKDMTVIGITGTNGKSSTALLTQHILKTCGCPAACFGTLGYSIAGVTLQAKHTTPFGDELAAIFRRAREARQSHVVMEVSSHALAQERVAGIDFDVAAFTNLTQDHLDFHQDMEAYGAAKLLLFERLEGPGRFTVVNREDPAADAFIRASRVACFTYGKGADVRAVGVRAEGPGTGFRVESPWGEAEVTVPLVGKHNVLNTLCAIAICGGLELPLSAVAAGLASAPVIPGRFERVSAGQDFEVIVDYAHTEDGLRNVLKATRALTRGNVIVVFGCGGDRDRGKRPKMGAAAGELADYAIITSDNPRTEDPEQILLDIEVGIRRIGKHRPEDYNLILDRAEAIRLGIAMAKSGDAVLIAGKGHEDYQILGTERIHFDDREVARAALEGS